MRTVKELLTKLLPKIYEFIFGNAIYNYHFFNVPKDSFLHPSHKIINAKGIYIGDGVTIEKDVWLNSINENKKKGSIEIGNGTKIGQRSTISSINKITIGKNVLFGVNIYVSDHEHNYSNIKIPILFQGAIGNGTLVIEDGSWIGNNVVISTTKDIVIGKNSVIGANSVVKESIPDFSLAVGSPAKVIKKYDTKLKKWRRVR